MIQERKCLQCEKIKPLNQFGRERCVCDLCVDRIEHKRAYNRERRRRVMKAPVEIIIAPILKSWGYLTGQIADSGDWNRVGRSPDA